MVAVKGNLMSDRRLTGLNDMLVAARQRTIEARARAEVARKLNLDEVVSGTRPDGTSGVSTTLANLRQQYSTQAAALGSLESQLGPRHPRLQAARSSLERIGGEIRIELQRQAAAARADYEQAQRTEQDLGRELSAENAAQADSSGNLVQLNDLERKAAAARDLYEALLRRSGQSGDVHDASRTNVRVISEAVPPPKADGPGRTALMVAGLFGGALFGAALGMAAAACLGLMRHHVPRS
jgi:uncharacterized protein involved in exopolysaccharide biosynthesis